MTDKKYTEELLRVGDLHVDPRIQRLYLNIRKVERIVMNFNEGALGVLTVSRRDPDTQVVIDGMHRQEAIRRARSEDFRVATHVFEGLTPQEEAQLFLDLNSGDKPNLHDLFRVRLVSGDPAAVEIDKLVRAYGWTVGSQKAQGVIKAVGTLDALWLQSERQESDLLQLVIMTISRAWGREPEGTRAPVLVAVAAVITEYGDQLDMDRLRHILANYPGGPAGLWSDGKQFAATRRTGAVPMGIAERIVDEYNKGLRSKTLHPWRRHKM